MRTRLFLLLAILVLVGLAVSPAAASYADLITGWYRSYLGRDPSRNDVVHWTAIIRTRGAPFAQASILGGDEYFARHKRSIDPWIGSLFDNAFQRSTTPREIAYLTERLNEVHRGNRSALVLELLQTPEGQTLPPTPNPGAERFVETARRMAALSRMFLQTAARELGGTSPGRQIRLRGNALAEASERVQQAIERRAPGDEVWRLTEDVARTMQALDEVMHLPPGTAPETSRVHFQLAFVAEALVQQVPRTGPGNGIGNRPPEVRRLAQLVQQAGGNSEKLAAQLRSVGQPTASLRRLIRETETLTGLLGDWRAALVRGDSREQLRQAFRPVREQANWLADALRTSNPPGVVRQTWWEITQSLDEMTDILGMGDGLHIDPSEGVPPNLPGYGRFPFSIRGSPSGPPRQDVTGVIDNAVGELDALAEIVSRMLLVPSSPAARFLGDCRDLRASLLQLREQVAREGNPRDVQATLRTIAALHERAAASWTLLRKQTPLQVDVDFGRLDGLLAEANRLLS